MPPFIAHYASPIGTLEIVANDQHLLSILFLETQKRPASGQTPSTEISDVITLTMQQLDAYFAGTLQYADLPMQLKGTVFQQRVWAELMNIPYGQTISYLELARRLGDEKCIRAAGMANGQNPVTIFVPCHRVIGSDGKLVGYGGDLWRKAWLLRHEMEHGPAAGGGVVLNIEAIYKNVTPLILQCLNKTSIIFGYHWKIGEINGHIIDKIYTCR